MREPRDMRAIRLASASVSASKKRSTWLSTRGRMRMMRVRGYGHARFMSLLPIGGHSLLRGQALGRNNAHVRDVPMRCAKAPKTAVERGNQHDLWTCTSSRLLITEPVEHCCPYPSRAFQQPAMTLSAGERVPLEMSHERYAKSAGTVGIVVVERCSDIIMCSI
jgi:hypothetical protein